jgi:hypothetical protein
MVNYAALQAEHDRQAKQHEQGVVKRLVAMNKQIERLLNGDPNDPTVAAIEMLLKTRQGDADKVAELLGIAAPATNGTAPAGPAALTVGRYANGIHVRGTADHPDALLPFIEEDGTVTRDYKLESSALAERYALHMNDQGQIDGFKRDVHPATTVMPATPALDLDQLVPLLNKKGTKVGEIKIYDGKSKADLVEVDASDPTKGFKPRPWSARK